MPPAPESQPEAEAHDARPAYAARRVGNRLAAAPRRAASEPPLPRADRAMRQQQALPAGHAIARGMARAMALGDDLGEDAAPQPMLRAIAAELMVSASELERLDLRLCALLARLHGNDLRADEAEAGDVLPGAAVPALVAANHRLVVAIGRLEALMAELDALA